MKKCVSCEKEYPEDHYLTGRNTCRSCRNKKMAEWRKRNPIKSKETLRRSQLKHRAKRTEETKKWIENNRERYKKLRREYARKWRKENPEKNREAFTKTNHNLKNKATHKIWYLNNRERLSQKRKVYYQEKREHYLIMNKINYQRNRVAAFNRAYKRKKKIANVDDKTINQLSVNNLLNKQNNVCNYCNSHIANN